MFIKATVVIFATISMTSVSASTYVKCGRTVNLETEEVTGYELELTSESSYNGPAGKNWSLKLDEHAEWMKLNPKIVASQYEELDNTIVEVRITDAMATSGPVGTRYKLIGLYDDEPVLEKYTMGGFAGTVRVGKFKCFSSID